LAEQEALVEQNHQLAYQHNQQVGQTAHQIKELLRLNCPLLQTILVQTSQVQIQLHHPGAGVVEDIVEEEEAADLVEEAEEVVVVEEEGNKLNFKISYALKRGRAKLFSDGLFFNNINFLLLDGHIRSTHVPDTNIFSVSFFK
jgi:hypothetical protein